MSGSVQVGTAAADHRSSLAESVAWRCSVTDGGAVRASTFRGKRGAGDLELACGERKVRGIFSADLSEQWIDPNSMDT